MPLELAHSTGTTTHFEYPVCSNCWSQWPRRLRRRFYGHSPAKIVGSNPTGGHWRLFVVSAVCGQRSQRRADHSPRGVVPPVVRRCVWSRNLKNEEAMACVGEDKKKTINCAGDRTVARIQSQHYEGFSPSTSIVRCHYHIHVSVIYHRHYSITLAGYSIVKQHTLLSWGVGRASCSACA